MATPLEMVTVKGGYATYYNNKLALCLLAVPIAATAVAQECVLHFPANRSLGELVRLDEPRDYDSYPYWYQLFPDTAFADATSDVTVPAGARLGLVITPATLQGLPALAGLEPNSIEAVVIKCTQSEVKAGDSAVAAAAKLRGLKTLVLFDAGVTGAGLASLAAVESLERLSVMERELDDAAFGQIAQIHTLKALNVNRKAALTPENLSELAKIPALEEVHLSALRLDAYASLKSLPAARYLDLQAWCHTVQGVAQLAHMPNLEKLRFADLTDEELDALPDMPKLKSLEIIGKGYEYTSAGFANLGRFASLESLIVNGRFYDDAFAAFPHLQSLNAGHTFAGSWRRRCARFTYRHYAGTYQRLCRA